MDSPTLEETERYSASKAVAPRVSLDDMHAKIVREDYLNAGECALGQHDRPHHPLDVLTICLLTMANGFTVIGKSAPASPENFDEEKGRRFAYEDAIKQLWPLEGYALREKLAA